MINAEEFLGGTGELQSWEHGEEKGVDVPDKDSFCGVGELNFSNNKSSLELNLSYLTFNSSISLFILLIFEQSLSSSLLKLCI